MSKNKSRQQLIAQLERLAFYRPNDGIRLALEGGGADIQKLRLEGVAEFRYNSSGTVELKFFDRIKVLELLLRLQGETAARQGGMLDFLQQVAGEEQQ